MTKHWPGFSEVQRGYLERRLGGVRRARWQCLSQVTAGAESGADLGVAWEPLPGVVQLDWLGAMWREEGRIAGYLAALGADGVPGPLPERFDSADRLAVVRFGYRRDGYEEVRQLVGRMAAGTFTVDADRVAAAGAAGYPVEAAG